MKRRIIVGNWKMSPGSLTEAQTIVKKVKTTAAKLKSLHVVLCPPSIFLAKFLPQKGRPVVTFGAQNLYHESQGAHTGEISATMQKDLGVTHVILGHSERRELGETDEIVSKKVLTALETGIHPIVCVGEKERDAHGAYLDILKQQIRNSLAKIPKRLMNQILVAYEPVWAIGGKEAMEPANIEEMAIFIKKVLADMSDPSSAISTPILYGGSVNFRNAPDIISRGKVDGLLVGHESVNTPGFIELLKVVDATK
jgi:triosephosphate isomerase